MKGIQEKIKIAKIKKEKLLKDPETLQKINKLLNKLRYFILEAEKERVSTGMANICAKCAIENKSCCGSEIELKYSPELLTINLLYEKNLPQKAELPGMCYFLTEQGCSLFARDVFCINFICDKIKDSLTSDKIKKLRELEGLQLNLQFTIEEILKKIQ